MASCIECKYCFHDYDCESEYAYDDGYFCRHGDKWDGIDEEDMENAPSWCPLKVDISTR